MTDTITKLRDLMAKATPGPWEIDTERSEGEYGSAPDTSTGYDDFLIGAFIDGKWATLLTTENSTVKEIEEDYDEDYHRAWDRIGEVNANLAMAAVNALPELLDRIAAKDAMIANMRKALAPFATEAEAWSPEMNAGHIFEDNERADQIDDITVGHLRCAQAAYAEGQNEQ